MENKTENLKADPAYIALKQTWDIEKANKDRKPQISQSKFATKADISQSAASQYLNAQIPLNYPILVHFASYLGCSLRSLDPDGKYRNLHHAEGVSDMTMGRLDLAFERSSKANKHVASMFDLGPDRRTNRTHENEAHEEDRFIQFMLADRGGPRKVPIISWVQAGHWSEIIDSLQPGEGIEWLWCPEGNPSENTFGLKVRGDSMTAQSPADRNYPDGCIIFVDPNKRVENGSRVVAKLPEQEEATFKIYKEDMGRRKLVPINTRVYDVVDITDMDVTICGVVIGSYMPE